jgi:hypothetical protein
MTTPNHPVTITIAVPTPFAVDPARLVAWLEGRGWIECAPSSTNSCYREFAKDDDRVIVPRHPEWCDYAREMAESIKELAIHAGMAPHALAALLAPPVEGPALQWAMMSERARAEVIARIADLASTDRKSVAILRADGCADQALEAEGDALGLEAAAAVLRGGACG